MEMLKTFQNNQLVSLNTKIVVLGCDTTQYGRQAPLKHVCLSMKMHGTTSQKSIVSTHKTMITSHITMDMTACSGI